MVFEDEHSARIKDPDQFIRIRREGPKDHDFGSGIHIYWGIKSERKEGPEGGRAVVQSIHFDKDKFSPGEAKAWLKEHDFKAIDFVPAGKEASMNKQADILYPNLVAPEDFRTGDVVRKIFGDFRVTEYLGIVLAIHPTTNTVDVRWPYGIGFENPQDLVRVNPWFQPPSVVVDSEGYYSTWDAERWNSPDPENSSTKGVSGQSPLYIDSVDVKTSNTLTNFFGTSITIDGTVGSSNSGFPNANNWILSVEKAPKRVASRFLKRAFNVLLRAATVPYNAHFKELETYKFLYERFGSIYAEPTIRSVTAYLYCKPHNYFIEDFDETLKQATILALKADKKGLQKVFKEIIDLTKGKKTAKISDLITEAIDAPYAKAVYEKMQEVVKRSKGNLDLLPTPAARFASGSSDSLEKIAQDLDRVIMGQEKLLEFLIDFGSQDNRADFTYDEEFRNMSKDFTVKFRGKGSINLFGVPESLEKDLEDLIKKYDGNIDWTAETAIPEEAGL